MTRRIPILNLGQILLTSIQLDLTDHEALTFQADLLRRIETTRAMGAVIDISALDVVDSYMARVLAETANMARLVGADIVVCGMHPEVALTLIEMGRALDGIRTALNLDQGMAALQHLLKP